MALPPGLPTVVDLGLPLLISLCEFLQFAVLTPSIVPVAHGAKLIGVWFLIFGTYAILAHLNVLRIMILTKRALRLGAYSATVAPIVNRYSQRLPGDAFGAGVSAVFAVTLGMFNLQTEVTDIVNVGALIILGVLMVYTATVRHSWTARRFTEDLIRI